MSVRPLFIAGATGKQGGGLIRALIQHPSFDAKKYPIYALTRDPTSESSKLLAARSPAIKLVKGTLEDTGAVFRSLPEKPWGVFIVTMVRTTPPEEVIGTKFIDEVIKIGAKHIVLSSVDRGAANNGNNKTSVPHFASKHVLEDHLLKHIAPGTTYTILRPVFFLENLDWGFLGKLICTAWKNTVKVPIQLIDPADIGKIGANAFMESENPEYKNTAISIAGDELTFEQANEIFKKKIGSDIPTTWGILGSLMLWADRDTREMYNFFRNPGFGADVKKVNKLAPMNDFAKWVDGSSFAKKRG